MLTKVIIKISSICRPLLLKIVPYKTLKKIKKAIEKKSYKQMETDYRAAFQPTEYNRGVNLIGNAEEETGLGQSMRLLKKELEQSQLPVELYQYPENKKTKNITEPLYGINIVHINPQNLGLAYSELDKQVWNKRYNIGFWLWELEKFPNEWKPCLQLMDEIWTPSEFSSRSIQKCTEKKVVTIPYYIEADFDKKYDRDYFGLPKDKFLVLIMYDLGSLAERKNPDGALSAYKKVFGNNDETGLIIKINHCSEKEYQRLHEKVKDIKNVYIITETLEKIEVNSLIKEADVLMSLHRAEGFGLVMAEAMLLGTPVIATKWSANIEFMNAECTCLVDYRLVEIPEDYGFFEKGNRWAEPNTEEAARYLEKLYLFPDFREVLVQKAQNHIKTYLSMEKAVNAINKRFDEIYETYD